MASLVNLKFKATTAGATKKLLPQIARDFNKIIQASAPRLERQARLEVLKAITSHRTYKSLFSNDPDGLRAHFGIEDYTIINDIVNIWVDSIEVEIRKVVASGTRLSGGFSVFAIDASYQDVLNSEAASYISEVTASRGLEPSNIEWLRWLLLEGLSIIVYGFDVDTNLQKGDNSRTGLAVMAGPKRLGTGGAQWSVPFEYHGTERRNWITEAIDIAGPKINEIVLNEIASQLGPVQRFS